MKQVNSRRNRTKNSGIGPSKNASQQQSRQRRLPPGKREQIIVDEAIHFFARYGFDAGTNELANRIGIAQPLLFKYFPTKESLIERVYEEVFPGRWDIEWEKILFDDSIGVKERITKFYKNYSKVMLTFEVTRITLYAGLSRPEYTKRFYEVLRKRIFERIVIILRREVFDSLEIEISPTEEELELVQALHGSIYHLGLRKWVHEPPLEKEIDEMVEARVAAFLSGARRTIEELYLP